MSGMMEINLQWRVMQHAQLRFTGSGQLTCSGRALPCCVWHCRAVYNLAKDYAVALYKEFRSSGYGVFMVVV